ncbi:hypothetical protein BX600DRAFT_82725 [Xylariales sp. PMI_506]|nr:hypothetical protein BX600DRAFT_82725 [Xylariales sp. PMI_506]
MASTGYELALTTTFTPPAQCTKDSFSQLPDNSNVIWNAIKSGVDGSWSTCLPSQFYSSVLATESSVSLPAFTDLVCPSTWEPYYLNNTYLVCCPPDFMPYEIDFTNTQRPAADAVCGLEVFPDVLMDITSYDASGGSTIIPTSAPTSGTLVLAWAYDGIAATPTTGVTITPVTPSPTTGSSATITAAASTSSTTLPASTAPAPSTTSSSSGVSGGPLCYSSCLKWFAAIAMLYQYA